MPRTQSSTPTSRVTHADGDQLVAVAEGTDERQPDETTLAHIFSCQQCSANVREIRSGLAALSGSPSPSAAAEVPPIAADAAAGLITAPDAAPASAEPVEARARGLIWKIALVGVGLTIALLYLRSLAGRMN